MSEGTSVGEQDGRGRSGRTTTAMAIVAVAVVAICIVVGARWLVGPDSPAHEAVGTLDETVKATPSPAVGADGLFPTQIMLPTVGVETAVEPKHAMPVYSPDQGRTVAAFGLPSQTTRTAWWSNGPRPGAQGMSVLVGKSGDPATPGAFDGIGNMRRGDKIVLRSARDEVVTYLVSDVVSGVRAGDPVALRKALDPAPIAKAVALVTYDAADLLSAPERAEVVVFGHLRSD